MFNLSEIELDKSNHHFICRCACPSEDIAIKIEQEHFKPIRMQYYFADLYHDGNILILDTPTIEKTKQLALLLNESIQLDEL